MFVKKLYEHFSKRSKEFNVNGIDKLEFDQFSILHLEFKRKKFNMWMLAYLF
jgi:hypothetical protein